MSLLTVIRTCPSRTRDCGRTVDSLIESNGGAAHRIVIVSSTKTPNENGLDCMRAGVECSKGDPFIFLEDDLAFIRGFNRAAEDFTRLCAGVRSLILPLGAAYKDLADCRGMAWRFPVPKFYGTQAFVIHPKDAESFLAFCSRIQALPTVGFDLLLKDWAHSHGKQYFLTPHRSFVQHMGVHSSLHNGRFHFFPSWPGPDWEYRCGGFSIEEQASRPCDEPLAKAVAEWFGPKSIAWDLGCSTGKYVKALIAAGIHARGFDVTPGLEGELITELDLARPQKFTEKPGNVMCLEVAEHIHQQDEQHLIANIRALCADKLVLSWAVPGQGGRRHVNERAPEDVHNLLRSSGFAMDPMASSALQSAATIKWFKNSLYAFRRQKP